MTGDATPGYLSIFVICSALQWRERLIPCRVRAAGTRVSNSLTTMCQCGLVSSRGTREAEPPKLEGERHSRCVSRFRLLQVWGLAVSCLVQYPTTITMLVGSNIGTALNQGYGKREGWWGTLHFPFLSTTDQRRRNYVPLLGRGYQQNKPMKPAFDFPFVTFIPEPYPRSLSVIFILSLDRSTPPEKRNPEQHTHQAN